MEFKTDRNKVVGTANVALPLTERDIESIMVGGIEGGIGYWAGINNVGEAWENRPEDYALSEMATKILLDGGSVEFYDVEDKEEKWSLTLEKLITGFAQNFNERPNDNSIEDGDASTYDSIIQYALFGKIVYG